MSIQEGYQYNFVNEGYFPWEEVTPLNEKTEEITLKLPVNSYWNFSLVNPEIFALSLERTPNIKTLNITKLEDADALLLNPILDLFKKYYPNLANLNIHTPNCSLGNEHLEAEVGQLYNNLMNCLAGPHLTQLTINDDTFESFLNSEILSNFFTNSPNLQTINVCLKENVKNLYIPFNLCQNLEQVSLECFGTLEKTFESLKDCKKLHTLILKNFLAKHKLIKFLIEHHGLNLRTLDLCDSHAISSDYELFTTTKQLSNLEVFGQTSDNQITDEGLALLGKNCPKLTSFSFCFEHITPKGFTQFIQKVNHLQKLKTWKAYHLNEDSLIELAKNCPQLKSLELVHWKDITEPGLIALTKYCPQLEYIKISCCTNVSLQGVEKLIQNAPQLKIISLWIPPSEAQKPLRKKYPHLNWYPNFKDIDSIPLDPPAEIHKAKETPTFSQELLNHFLLESVRYEQLENILQSIKLGADPNAIQPKPTSNYNENSFVLSAQQGNLEIMRTLVLNGADASVLFKGKYAFNTIENIVKNPEIYTYLTKDLEVSEFELQNLLEIVRMRE